MTPPDEYEAAQVARLDQIGAELGQRAGVLGQFFRRLQDIGFEREEAFELTREWFRAWTRYLLDATDPDPT